MNTPTPRTNRAWNILGDDNAEAAWSFARTLERELAESRNAERLARVQLAAEREKVKRLVEINEFVGSAQLKAEREKVRKLFLDGAISRLAPDLDVPRGGSSEALHGGDESKDLLERPGPTGRGLDQLASRTGECGTHRSARQSQRAGDIVVADAAVLQHLSRLDEIVFDRLRAA